MKRNISIELPFGSLMIASSNSINIGFPGQIYRFVIPFDEGVIQIREINLGHEIRRSNLYFGH